MGSGGKRLGAGRPMKLDDLARLSVGLQCENQRQIAVEQSIKEAINKSKGPAIRRIQDVTANIPVHKRAAWIKNVYNRDGYTLKDDANFERRELAGINADEPDDVVPFLRTISPKRPIGINAAILADVASETKIKYPNQKITPRFVKTCWSEYRSFIKSLDSEDL